MSRLERKVTEELVSEHAQTILHSHEYQAFTNQHAAYTTSLQQHVSDWRDKTTERLSRRPLSDALQQELRLFEQSQGQNSREFHQALPELMAQLDGLSAFAGQVRELEGKAVNQGELLAQWQEHLSHAIIEAKLAELDAERQELIEELRQRSHTIEKLSHVTDVKDAEHAGRLWDLTDVPLSKGNIGHIEKFSRFLQQHADLKNLAQELGQQATAQAQCHTTPKLQMTKKVEWQRNPFIPEDMVGLHLHNNLLRLLPTESLFLTDPELEFLFYKQLVESQLLHYLMQGQAPQPIVSRAYKQVSQQALEPSGPFIIALDGSASMYGFAEQCAKALCYGLMQIALADDRRCIVLLFSTRSIAFELTGYEGLHQALQFLAYQFHGGTDFAPMLEQSLQLMQRDSLRNADLLVISDFMAAPLSQAQLAKLEAQQQQGNRYHALCLSRYANPELLAQFASRWHYSRQGLEKAH